MKHRVPRVDSVERESDQSPSHRKQSGSDPATDQLHNSPRQLLQEQRVNAAFGKAVQRVADDDELLQGKFDTAQRMDEMEDEEIMQGKFAPVQRQSLELEDEMPMQGKFSSSAPAQLQAESPAENLTGMPDQLKTGIESLSGIDMAAVRVHRNSPKPAQLSALAYAQGNDIHLGPGQEQHLPHEAWHVVQQREGRVQATTQMQGVGINDDVGLEREADVMGSKAIQAKRTPVAQFVNQHADRMRNRRRFKRSLQTAIRRIRALGANGPATAAQILIHDEVQYAGQHHGFRVVTVAQLVNDIRQTIAHQTALNLADSDDPG